jgi:hypothetical protein
MLKGEGVGTPLYLYRPLWTDKPFAKRRRAAYGGTVGPRGSPMGPDDGAGQAEERFADFPADTIHGVCWPFLSQQIKPATPPAGTSDHSVRS